MRWQTPSWRRNGVIAAIVIVVGHAAGAGGSRIDPFAFFDRLVTLTDADRTRLAGGDVVVRVLSGSDGHLGVFAASRVDAPAATLVEWVREIEAFKQSNFVVAVRRFSEPPVPADLDGLWLDPGDVESIRECRADSCGLKLAAHEIAALRAAADDEPEWQAAVQDEFRRVVYNRVLAYRSGGLDALPPSTDRRDRTTPGDALAAVLEQSGSLVDQLPDVAARLRASPAGDIPATESFVYWSKEDFGAGKRVVAVTHVDIVWPDADSAPVVLALAKEILATHYRTASLGVMAIVEDPARADRYLVYVNRSQVDLLGGLFGGLKRKVIEGRLAGDSTAVMRLVRKRLESGLPPGTAG